MSDLQFGTSDENCPIVTMDNPSRRSNRSPDLFKEAFEALPARLEGASPVEPPRGLVLRSAKASFGVGERDRRPQAGAPGDEIAAAPTP